MNTEEILQRLLAKASQAPQQPEEPPLGLEGRIMAGWRSEPTASLDIFPFLRVALACALLFAAGIGALNYKELTEDATMSRMTNGAFLTVLNR